MIEFVSGDMFIERIIAHGVNCVGVMGAGVALQVRERYPAAYLDYKAACPLRLGIALRSQNVWHLATQHDPGPFARLDAIDSAVRSMIKQIGPSYVVGMPVVIGMPRIGAGIGGLAWSDVKLVLQRACERSSTVLVRVYERAADRQRGPHG